ncbi:hypothetical protein DFH11DRAFT_1801994 [Phellopilus nigrolimitatus]|nr:hypothetical protein DFH11DRAFT_1801994 [Phellopilus nigrolimitatus]
MEATRSDFQKFNETNVKIMDPVSYFGTVLQFESDEEEEEAGVFSSSDGENDDGDEKQDSSVNGQRKQLAYFVYWLDGVDKAPAEIAIPCSTPTSVSSVGAPAVAEAKHSANEDSDSDSSDEEVVKEVKKEHGPPMNKFLVALTNAVESYSSRLRVPFAPSSITSAVEPSPPSIVPQPHLALVTSMEDISDEDPEDEDTFSSEDEYSDDELLGDKPKLDADQAAKLVYQPTGPWSELANEPIENPVVIAKLAAGAMCEASIKQGTIRGRRITYISKTFEWDGFFSEMALYSHPAYLRPLQGIVIPTIIGLYLVDGAISVAMELPSSSFWIEASEDMSDHLKRKCIAAFDAIHDRGVLHDDVELRHMLISKEGDVTIIDFQESRALNPIKDVNLKAATEADIRLEKRKVLFKLNFGEAREDEKEKRSRVYEKRALNKQRRERRAVHRAQVAKGEILPPLDGDESEPDDPDDILNPIIEPHIWSDYWIGEDFDPDCYVVPGQDEEKVCAMLDDFILKEIERQEEDDLLRAEDEEQKNAWAITTQECKDNPVSTPIRVPLTPALDSEATSTVIHHLPSVPLSLSTSTPTSSLHPIMTPTSQPPSALPILPIRVSVKRERDGFDDSFSGDFPSPKKRQILSASESVPRESDSSVSTEVTTPSTAPSTFPPLVVNGPLQKIPAVIQVPYEDYTGPDGFTIPNTYNPREIANMRRLWIMQDNIERCKEDGLRYPLAQRLGLTPNSDATAYEIGRNGKMKKKKMLINRGALKREQMEMEKPGKRKRDAEKRRAKYLGRGERKFFTRSAKTDNGSESDEEDDCIGEGPKILSWTEFKDEKNHQPSQPVSNLSCSVSQSSSPSVAAVARPQSILRRQLNAEEKNRQRSWLEYLKQHQPQSTDDDEEDSQVLDERPRKRVCVDGLSPSVPEASPSSVGHGFQRYSGASNAFAVRSAINSGVHLPTFERPHQVRLTMESRPQLAHPYRGSDGTRQNRIRAQRSLTKHRGCGVDTRSSAKCQAVEKLTPLFGGGSRLRHASFASSSGSAIAFANSASADHT